MTLMIDERVVPLIKLTRQFLAGDLEAKTFDEGLRDLFSQLPPGVDDETFFALENLVVACSDYVAEPEFRLERTDLDEEGLRAAANVALTRLDLA